MQNVLLLTGTSPLPSPGWHLRELQAAAARQNVSLTVAPYDSLQVRRLQPTISAPPRPAVDEPGSTQSFPPSPRFGEREPGSTQSFPPSPRFGERGSGGEGSLALSDFSAILTRTMPAGTLEQITFRLAALHAARRLSPDAQWINPPAALELAIDKYATLALASHLNIPVPPTSVTQTRTAALAAFDELGSDVLVKPLFGGEGRGIMRVQNRETAWTVFSTLQTLGAVIYQQQFIPPGGIDHRYMVIGEHIHVIRRTHPTDFRANVAGGGVCRRIDFDSQLLHWTRQITAAMGLIVAAVDFLPATDTRPAQLIEVNAVPGWRGAQGVIEHNIADQWIAATG